MHTYTLELHCPDIVTQADAMQAKSALGNSPGFDRVEFDLSQHRLVVTTANQDRGQDAIYRLARAGYPPDESTVIPVEAPQPKIHLL